MCCILPNKVKKSEFQGKNAAYVRDLRGNLVGEFFSRDFFNVLSRVIVEAIRVPD
jgi:hypothetical protein